MEWQGCKECGDTNDLLARFTAYGLCGACTRKAHRKAVGKA